MKLNLKTEPERLPVTVSECADWLRVSTDDENILISSLIKAATKLVEMHTGRALITQTYELDLCSFSNKIILPYPRLQSVTFVKYYDLNNDLQTLDSAKYEVTTKDEPAYITLESSQLFPSTYDRPDAVKIEYISGYGDTEETVPEALKVAIKLMVSNFYENRQPVITTSSKELELSLQFLLSSYKVHTV